LAIALPATARTFGISSTPQPQACIAIGGTTWRIASGAANVTVAFAGTAAAPDVRIQFAETSEQADFVFVDDGMPASCQNDPAIRTVAVAPNVAEPDLTVGFASRSQAADYRVYVRSQRFSPEAVAALFAAAHMPPRNRTARAD
jgi:hypothetical protein